MKLLKRAKTVAIVFYVLAALFLFYTIFTAVTTVQYLASVASSGMYVQVTASDMISAFVGQIGPYLFDTMVLFGCGYLIQLGAAIVGSGQSVSENTNTAADLDYDAQASLSGASPATEVDIYGQGEPMAFDLDNERIEIEPSAPEEYTSFEEETDQMATDEPKTNKEPEVTKVITEDPLTVVTDEDLEEKALEDLADGMDLTRLTQDQQKEELKEKELKAEKRKSKRALKKQNKESAEEPSVEEIEEAIAESIDNAVEMDEVEKIEELNENN